MLIAIFTPHVSALIAVITSTGQASVYTTIVEDESAATMQTPNGDVSHQQHAPPLQVCFVYIKRKK